MRQESFYQVTVRIPATLHGRISDAANTMDDSMSKFIMDSVRIRCEEMENENEKENAKDEG